MGLGDGVAVVVAVTSGRSVADAVVDVLTCTAGAALVPPHAPATSTSRQEPRRPTSHVELVQDIFAKIGLDTATETPAVKSMKDAAEAEAKRKAE